MLICFNQLNQLSLLRLTYAEVVYTSEDKRILQNPVAQQSVHLTLGILRQSQAVSHALAFFWLDGFAVPAPAQVTQTVGWLPA